MLCIPGACLPLGTLRMCVTSVRNSRQSKRTKSTKKVDAKPGLGMIDIISVVSMFEPHEKLNFFSFFTCFARNFIHKQMFLLQHKGSIHKSYLTDLHKNHAKHNPYHPFGYEENRTR